MRLSTRARATDSVRLAAPSLPRTWPTCLWPCPGDHQFAGTGLVWPARRQYPQHLQLAAGQRSM